MDALSQHLLYEGEMEEGYVEPVDDLSYNKPISRSTENQIEEDGGQMAKAEGEDTVV
jgi:hypothetical protein